MLDRRQFIAGAGGVAAALAGRGLGVRRAMGQSAALPFANGERPMVRTWGTTIQLPSGTHALQARATSRGGEVQPVEARWNPAGYMRNVIETVRVEAA